MGARWVTGAVAVAEAVTAAVTVTGAVTGTAAVTATEAVTVTVTKARRLSGIGGWLTRLYDQSCNEERLAEQRQRPHDCGSATSHLHI
jgi:hypothetical protein